MLLRSYRLEHGVVGRLRSYKDIRNRLIWARYARSEQKHEKLLRYENTGQAKGLHLQARPNLMKLEWSATRELSRKLAYQLN